MHHPQTIAISGASGLVGSALCESLQGAGHHVRRLVRRRPASDSADIYWRPSASEIDDDRLNCVDAVVHLAGENIAEGRWTEAKKQAIAQSRIEGTRLLSEAIASLDHKPRVLVERLGGRLLRRPGPAPGR